MAMVIETTEENRSKRSGRLMAATGRSPWYVASVIWCTLHMYPEYLKVHFSNLVSSIRWFHRLSLYYYWWPLDTIHRWERGSPRTNVFISKYEPIPSFPPKYLLVTFPLFWKELTLSTINVTNYQGLIPLLVGRMSIYSQNIFGGLPVLQCIDWLRLLRVTHWIKSTQTVFSGSYRDT